jgi:hypothetical protein
VRLASRVQFALHEIARAAALNMVEIREIRLTPHDYEVLWFDISALDPRITAPPFLDLDLGVGARTVRVLPE